MDTVDTLVIPFADFDAQCKELIHDSEVLLDAKVTTEAELEDLRNDKLNLLKNCSNILKAAFSRQNNIFYTSFMESISNGYSIPGMGLTLQQRQENVIDSIKEIKRQIEYLLTLFSVSDLVLNPEINYSSRVDMAIDEKKALLLQKLYQLHKKGIHGYLTIHDIFHSNGVPVPYLEDFEIADNLAMYGYIEKLGYLGGMSVRIKAEGRQLVEQSLRQPRNKPEDKGNDTHIYNIGQAGAVGPGAHTSGSTFNQSNYSLPENTDYSELIKELKLLKAHLLDKAVTHEEYESVSRVVQALQGAEEKDGNKVVNALKVAGKFALEGARDIAANVLTAVIQKILGL